MIIEWSVDTTFEHVVLWTLFGSYILLWVILVLWVGRKFTRWIDRKLIEYSEKEKKK